MDYCHPCRRHLNGALACPGCGTPAEQLAPNAEEFGQEYDTGGDARDADPYGGDDPQPGRAARRREARGRRGREREPEEGPAPTGPAAAGASRRDRKAAAHRRRRRRTLLVAAGFVLAAGGLSLAELGMDAPGDSPQPAAAGNDTPDGGATSEVGAEPAAPLEDTSRSAAGPTSASPSPDDTSASPSASPSASESPDGSTEPAEAPPDTDSAPPPRPSSTPPAPADPPSTSDDPTTSAPAPEPTPTETCERFLWWCT
ncbi:SCO2400 family protein [Streptomyces poriticola]|uniref:SCO2400 family protein n=1 Tax=Streptomyces poriticola TaxID=3120506 RepID=UPI002FCDE51D